MSKEIIQMAEYTKINLSILKLFNKISLTKLIFLSFCVKNCFKKHDHLARKKYGVFSSVLQHFGAQYKLKTSEYFKIVDSLSILEEGQYICVDEGNVLLRKQVEQNDLEDLSKYKNIFDEIRKMNDSWFIEEIITYV